MDNASAFWLGSLKDWKFTKESAKDMLVVTKMMHSIEQMVGSLNPNEKMHVRLSSDRTMASDWAEHKIVLPSSYLWEQESFTCFAHIVDMWTALALHEAGHIALSQNLVKQSIGDSHEFILIHMVEDFWIEKWITDRFPGYCAYFERFKQQHFSDERDIGDDDISKRINDFLYLLHADGYIPLYQETQQALEMLIRSWEKAKAANQVENWDRIELGLAIFQTLFPNGITHAKAQAIMNLSNPSEIEPTAVTGKTGDSEMEMPSPYLLTGKVKVEQTIHYHRQVKSGPKISWASEQMIESWMNGESGRSQPEKQPIQSIIRRPELDAEALKNYSTSYMRVKPYVLKLRRKFEKANTPRMYESVHLHQGALDEEAVYRASFATDLFKTEEERWDSIGKWDITLLIDQSRSTENFYDEHQRISKLKRYEVATDLSVLFAEAFKQLRMIDLRVFAYSTASHSSVLQLDELYSPDAKKIERLGLIRPRHATPEYSAIKEMTLKVSEEGNKESQKLILVLSDGQPDDYEFGGGEEHKSKIKEWIQKWSRKGFSFAHIALSADSKGKEMYPESIHFEQDYSQLVAKVYQWISRVISK